MNRIRPNGLVLFSLRKQGKHKVCVPSSEDNHAVFAFGVLGAKVTSCDISLKQIEIAKKIAKEYHLDIEFICDDTRYLSKLPSEAYDLLYTSNEVHVWIDDHIFYPMFSL